MTRPRHPARPLRPRIFNPSNAFARLRMATSPLAKPPASPTRLQWSATTHAGRVRPNNEDTFLALTFDGHGVRFLGKHGEATLADADFVFAVSDGMGGAK